MEKRKPNHQHTLQAIATLGFWKNCLVLVKISNKLKILIRLNWQPVCSAGTLPAIAQQTGEKIRISK